jgi:tetratricopeptide (TPR) repeat protein
MKGDSRADGMKSTAVYSSLARVCFLVTAGVLLSGRAAADKLSFIAEETFVRAAISAGQHDAETNHRVDQDRDALLAEVLAGNPKAARLLDLLGVYYLESGDEDSAIKTLETTLQLQEREYGQQHPITITTLTNLGAAYRKAGRLSQAFDVLTKALRVAQAVYRPVDSHIGQILSNRSAVLLSEGKSTESLVDAKSASDIGMSIADTGLETAALANESMALAKSGRISEGIEAIKKAESKAKGNGNNQQTLILAKLSQIQVKLQGQAAELAFEEVASTPPPAPKSGLSDEQALNQLARLYDQGVTLHYLKVGGFNDDSVSRVRLEATREHILRSALSQRPGDHPPFPTLDDFARSPVERYYIEMAAGQPLSPEAARFRDEMRTELVEKRPDVWRVMKAKADGLAQSFQMPEDLGTLRAMLASRVATAALDVGHGLPPDIASLDSGIEESVAEDAYRVRSRKAWTAFLSVHDGKDVVAAMNDDDDPAAEIERDTAVARRVPEMVALEQRLAAEPLRFPTPPEPDAKEATEIARAMMATRPRDAASFVDSLATFDDFFPSHVGAETRTARGMLLAESGVEVQVPSEILARMATSFTRLRGFSRIGGVLIGRDASNKGERLDFNGLSWRTTPTGVVLTFTRADHKEISLDPRPPSLIAQALAYAADGRPVAATMTSAAPLRDLKVLAHPTLVDTAVGCRAIEIDRFVDTALSNDPRGTAIEHGVDEVFAGIDLYNYAQRAFSIGYLAHFPDGDKVSSMRERLSSQYDLLVSRAKLDAVDLNMLMDPARSPLTAKGAFFQTDVVKGMAECLPGAKADAEAFGRCMIEKGRTFEGKADGVLGPPTDFFPWSGVREREWSLDPDLAFATGSPARDPLYPFEFVEQLAALGPANFADDGEQSGESYVDADPFAFPGYQGQITQIVIDSVTPDPRWRENLEDMRQFTLLERLFRAALAGQLGPSFPIEKLSELADATSSTVKSAHTPRWTPHPGQIEKYYLNQMSDLADNLKSVGKYDKLVARQDACFTSLQRKAKTWTEAARIPDADWASVCDLQDVAKEYPELSTDSDDEATGRAAYLVELSRTLRLARQLRVVVGVPAEEKLIADQIRLEQAGGRICPAL